ncbi:MAG TPA: cytochrome P450 [Candidatus Binatia bacterium]|nr:cytochrome P450 [Candidatus Binatia bacterium]
MQLRDVNLIDPDVFVPGVPHEMFRVLRRDAPVYWHEGDGRESGFWAITKHADVKHVSRNPELFSSERKGVMFRDPAPHELPAIQAIMISMDPPRHRQYRNLVNKVFTPRMVERLRPRIAAIVDDIFDRLGASGECDFVEHVAAPLPMAVICEMMGVPDEDRAAIYQLSNRLIGFDDPELRQETPPDGVIDYNLASAEMFAYGAKLAERARRHPGDDLATALLAAEVDGERLSDLEFNSFFLLLAIAGNETTRTVTTNGTIALLEHPEQLAALRRDPSLIDTAVEEMLRWAPPVHHFRRTATEDTEIRGVRIRANDKLLLWYGSANRDEEVFAEPDRFDARRDPNEHLAFGIGEHFCLGASLARLELQMIFSGLVHRLRDLAIVAPPRRLRSNFINGVKEMQVRFTPESAAA